MLMKSGCHRMKKLIHQSIKINVSPLQEPYTQRRPRLRPSGREQSSNAGETEHMYRLGGASDLREARSRLLDQPLKRNGSALSQTGPPNRRGQLIAVYGGLLHKKRGRAANLAQIHVGGHEAGQFGATVLAQPFWRRTVRRSAVSAQDVFAHPQANNATNINMRCLGKRESVYDHLCQLRNAS